VRAPLLALIAGLTLGAACKRDHATREHAPGAPDPRLTAAFTQIFIDGTAAAAKARELQQDAVRNEVAVTPDDQHGAHYVDDYLDDHDLQQPYAVVGGIVRGTAPPSPPDEPRILYKRGLRGYADDRIDRQAENVRAAVKACLAADRDLAEHIAQRGGGSVTVRIDLDVDPPKLWVSNTTGLAACVEDRITPIPGSGTFITAVRIDG
jgi:hypothetical protein